jgi:signal transduction histidine kinase/ligand-binding sensor domain-containing protein
MHSSFIKKTVSPFIHPIIIVLLLFVTKGSISQVVLPSFNPVRGTNSYTLGKVVSMAQDKYGYMWFADQTNGVLVRYDGYRMKIFRNDPADSNSVGAKSFECITADASGNIWIGVPRGADKFDAATNRFIHYRYPEGGKDKNVNVILVDHSGIVWIGTWGGLDRLDPATGKFTHYIHSDKDPASLSSDIVRSLYEDKKGVLWAGTGFEFDPQSKDGGLNRFNKETETFTRYLHDPNDPHSLAGNKVRALFEDSKGNFWVGTDSDGLHLMNREKGTFERLTYDPLHPEKLSRPPVKKETPWDHITFITEDVSGKIWIGTYAEGITCYNPKTEKIDHFSIDDKKRPGGYTHNSTWDIYNSKEGMIWISNENNELFRVDPLQTGFTEVKLNATVGDFLEDSSGNLWMTEHEKGLVRMNKESKEKKYFSHNPADTTSISSNTGTFIQTRPDGQMWVGSYNGGNLFNPQTGRFKRYFYDPKVGFRLDMRPGVYAVFEKKDETYFGLDRGKIVVQNSKTGLSTEYINDPADTTSIAWGPPGSGGAVVKFLEKDNDNIWVSVWNSEGAALDLFNTGTKKFKHYLKGLIIWEMFKSSNGKMWVATSKGLYYRNDSLDSFIPVGPEESEFRNTKVKSLTEDAHKNIWGVSSIGIFRYNPFKDELSIYGDKFGVFDVGAFAYEPSYTSSNGELYFGNPHGYYKCFPNEVINPLPPAILITDFKIDGRSVKTGAKVLKGMPFEEAKEITLNYNQNKISIDFAAIHFSSPENNIHQYMLDGYDNEWRHVGEDKTAYFFNIPPGHYVFRIKASSSYGIIAEKSFKIIVLPPWWQTWWAYTSYVLLLFVAIWIFIKWRTGSLKKEKHILEAKVTERTRELKEEKEIVESTLAELKSTQVQLIQSEKMASLGELTAGIAHEIQNPLNFVNNFSEVSNELLDEMKTELNKGNIKDAAEIADDVKSNLEKILHHGKRADGIVKGMLQHSRNSSGIKESTDINALCDEYLRLSYHGLRAKDKSFNATMKTDFDKSIGNINIISQDIGRVVLNLINNAFYAVDEKKKLNEDGYEPTVTVSTKKNNGKVEIRVIDNGSGIPQKVLDKIFQPFFTTKPTGQGTGLGLSLSYDIVKAHGGEIKVQTKEKEGTEFIIILPA